MGEGEQHSGTPPGWAPTGDGQVQWWDGQQFVGDPAPDPGPGPWPAGWYPHPDGPHLGYWDGNTWGLDPTAEPAPGPTQLVPPAEGATATPGGQAGVFVRQHWFPLSLGALGVAAAVVIAVGLSSSVDEDTQEAGSRLAGDVFLTALFGGWSTPAEAGGDDALERQTRQACQSRAQEVHAIGDEVLEPGQIDVDAAADICAEEALELFRMPTRG